MPPFALSLWIAKLRDEQNLKVAQIATILRMTEREIAKHIQALGDTHSGVRDAYLAGRIGLNTTLKLSRLRMSQQPDVLQEVLEAPDRSEGSRRADAAARSALRTEFRAWRRDPGAAITISGREKGPQEVCIKFPDADGVFDLFVSWVRPRLRRPGGTV